LRAHIESASAEQSRLNLRVNELQRTQDELEQQIKSVTQTLVQETTRRESAERQATEIGQRRSELDAQLEQLREEFEESQRQLELQTRNFAAEQTNLQTRSKQLEDVTSELAAARSQLDEKSLRGQQLSEKIAELERTKADLTAQVNTAFGRVKGQENLIRALEANVRRRQEDIHGLKSLLESEILQRRVAQSRVETLEKQSTDLSTQLSEKAAAEQGWHQRESELERGLRQQTAQLADSSALSRSLQLEISQLKSALDDLRVVESALCARVRELTNRHDEASKRILELDDEARAASKTIKARDQQLAALRHAILDAARNGSNVSRTRFEIECAMVDGWKRLFTTLLQTPLSTAQRGLVGEIASALDGFKTGRANSAGGVEFQVESPDLQTADFNCKEVIDCALSEIRKAAEDAGARVLTTLAGWVPESAHGSARQIHQLITMLTTSLIGLGSAENLDLQVSFSPGQNGSNELLLRLLLASNSSAEALRLRLTSLVEASATLRTGQFAGSELALTSAWQLALAMGGSPRLETTDDQKVCVKLSLLLEPATSFYPERQLAQEQLGSNGV
jgi:chromosome segregation ATPase